MSSLKDDVAHLKIPLENVLSATNNFASEYKGQFLWSGDMIDIHARRFYKDDEQQFWMEVYMLSSLKHKNVDSIVGFCDENDVKIIIHKVESRGRLITYLSDPMLIWVRRLEISVRIAHALSYIHYDEQRDFRVIHRNISSYTVFLNDYWEPKLCKFDNSMQIKASQRNHSFHTNTTMYVHGYGDPSYIETKSVNAKSDMYSFGIVLFELLCGRESIRLGYMDPDHHHLAPLATTHYREKKLNNIIHPELWKQMDLHSFNMFAEIAYQCLDEERSRRPDIYDIVQRLEKALELARENWPIHSSPNNLAHLRIPLKDLLSATNYFDEHNFIGKDEFGKRYKGQLLCSDELINIVAQRISYKEWDDEKEQQFWREIIMLSSLKHKNVISIVGFCNEVNAETIIYKHSSKGTLDNYLSDMMLLTWVKRLEICIGIAHALSYIHYDEPRDFSVIHRNISSEIIVLNNDWEPKLSQYQHSIKIKASERHHSFHTDLVLSRKGYTDPTCLKTNTMNQKSDIYSFGIVLFELLCSRKGVLSDRQDNMYLAPLAIYHYRENELDGIIDPNLWKQMDTQSFNIFAETAYNCLNEEQSERPNIYEIVTRLEKALELQLERENGVLVVAAELEGVSTNHEKGSVTYVSSGSESQVSKKTESFLKDLSCLKLSYQELESVTDITCDEVGFGNWENEWFFKGRLLRSDKLIDIFGKGHRSNSKKGVSKMFTMELSMLSSLNHKNVVSLIGFCDGEEGKAIIYKREANGSLKKYLSDETLSWMQRLKICTDVSNALSYIHYDVGRDFSVIHCNIKSSKILLDDKWEPKLSGFERSLKTTVARRHRLLLTRDVIGDVYMDPKYEKTGGVTHKSDVYSFGVVLFEVLCGRSARIAVEEDKDSESEREYYRGGYAGFGYREYDDDDELEEGLIISQLDKSHSDDMIMPHLRKQMDPKSFKIFSETAYWCIKDDRADRPYIDQVVKRLEKALEHQQKHENPVNLTSSNEFEGKNLEHLKIELNDINEATNNFDDAYCIGTGGFGKVYKGILEHFYSSNSSSKEGVDKCDLPRKRSMVAIKRIHDQGGEQGFIAEIETLTSCKHENIISLLGFCYEGTGAMILVYEHASEGSLENYLGSSDKINLTWVQRLNICLDIAHGLNYIHNNTDHGKQKMIHRDIKSDNILLVDNWKAKIADFGLSKFHPANQEASTIYTDTVAVLLEILTGRLAYDFVYTMVNEKGIAPIARDHFVKGTIMKIVDHKIKEETDEHVFSLSTGPDKESLDIFLKIAFQCVAETQAQRPTIEIVIKELKRALYCQENHKDNLKLSLEDVKLATQDFSQVNIIGRGSFGNIYRGEVTHAHVLKIIAAKRLDKKIAEREAQFATELEILMEYKHENVIGLVGYCDEEEEKIIVYQYASRGSLDKYLSDDSLTWVMRLKICIDIAIGLEFLHGTVSSREMVIQRNIKSSNILLLDDWKPKITDFGLSLVCLKNQNVDYGIDDVTGTIGYRDPLQSKTYLLTEDSDIFSLGAVLFDIMCGKISSVEIDDDYLYLPFLAKSRYQVGKLDELVFEGIKEQIVPQSFAIFSRIAYQCLDHRREKRPTAGEVIIQLKKALEFHEDYEKWETKLPRDYKEVIQMSKCPVIYSTTKKEELYNMFSKGILLQQDKVLLSFNGEGDRNELVSATMFTYVNSCAHKWRSLTESRFERVVEMLDISNLNIGIKVDTQLLSPNVVYGVYLVFKFSNSRNYTTGPTYVNLKYKLGHESLHAYFATQRDKDWMMIELYQFLNQNEDVDFEFILESFSTYYCGDGAIFVEGIEFRAIDIVKHEETKKLKEIQQVLKSNFNVDQVEQLPIKFEDLFKIHHNYDELFWLGEVNRKKLLVLSAKATLYNFFKVDLFTSKPSAVYSRFQEIELLAQQVFYLKCTIKSQMLSPGTEYACYLLFKLSEEDHGLRDPVKVRDILHQENKEAEFFVYFITSSQLNIHDFTRVPKQREDGWMEIQVWKFNSTHESKNGSLSIDMKFTCQEGIMSGLIICGLEFRPVLEVKVDGLPLLLDSLWSESDKKRKDTVQLETAVNTISQEYLLEFTSEYDIPEALPPELPGPGDRILDFPEGKIHLSQLSVIGTAKQEAGENTSQCYTKPLDSLKNWNNRFFWVDERVFPTVVDWRTSAPKDGLPAENTLIRAPNPTKVKTGSRPHAAHEVPLLTMTATRVIEVEDPTTTADSSGVPSTIERSPLDFANEAGPEDQGTLASEEVPTIRVLSRQAKRKVLLPQLPLREYPWGESLAAIELGMGSTRLAHVPPSAPADVSDPDPLCFADPQSRPPTDVAKSPDSIYRPEWGIANGSMLDTPKACQDLVDHVASRLFLGEAKLLRKSIARVARQDKRIQAREHEIKNQEALLEAEADMKKAAEDKSAKLSQELEDMRALFSDLQVEQRSAEMDARLDALSIDFDEELYSHMLTAIAGRRWMIGRELLLAVMKCDESLELRQAFADVVSTGIAKGMSEGLKHEVEHGHAQLNLEAIEAYDPEAEAKYIAALQALKDLKYPLVDQLEGLKDAPMDVIIAALYLESDIEEILLADAIVANISRTEKKKKCRVVCRTHGVGFAHHARSDGVLVSAPTVIPQGLAILLVDAATQMESDEASQLPRSSSLPVMRS
uniref:Protein kinase-like domain, phloem protein 2-like protein n=1 Tax=Tanacetum cinerariifolium TaxID=118510 RepID=A0A6L2NXE0_TANCI|nr:protein kinase-like domain, phloem protein 2-like protein [Tanacetum cinerariifolium]